MLAEHRNTILTLHIHDVSQGLDIALITGLGAVTPAAERVDISDALEEREFWALQVELHFASHEVEDAGREWLGVEPDAARAWYESRIDRHLLAGRWPYIRAPLPGSRYVELELAGGVEYQDR